MASSDGLCASQPALFAQRRITPDERRELGILADNKLFWRDHYAWLKDRGYLLRPRYSPNWIASWKEGGCKSDDDIEPAFPFLADATRISDGLLVLIKKCEPDPSDIPVFHEDQIFRRFSSELLASDAKNRCIRMVEILSVPDDPKLALIVMPFHYGWHLVPFSTIGEAVEFISEIFEGVDFMHKSQVWHGDLKSNNILMDASPLFVEPVNPRFRTRLRHPVSYHLIDFDLSGVHDPSKGPPRNIPGYGGTRGVPEFNKKDKLCDPFAVDVYCLGNVVRRHFTEGEGRLFTKEQRGFEFMSGLVNAMVNEDPVKRPKIDEVAEERLQQGLLPQLEMFWCDHYSWLEESGYKLRPRYSPDRVAHGKPGGIARGDDVSPAFSVIADTTRTTDDSLVLIKKCEPIVEASVLNEPQVFRRFSSDPLASKPKNHCVPLIEILPVPDDPKLFLIVTWSPSPRLGKLAYNFMHNNHIWHGYGYRVFHYLAETLRRDIKFNNILMDASPLLVDQVHPWRPSRTRDLARAARFRNRLEHPVKYYLIDFDLSGVHDPSTGLPLMVPGYGGTRGVPESQNKDEDCDPFAVDVFCLGNLVRRYFTEGDKQADLRFPWKKKRGFQFMEGLVADMTKEDPSKRANMDTVARRFSEIKAG
ncbi:hypothetical protein FB45DRAFT_1099009 [Roridomyces roridus]|uniref:Protein kinase domain-containing protein n=1 Tax=Roridomyces roridus TaxID=1738132 RepID=A0AAD7FZN7_9AGAR|nr:hypothetical protein FB45DRAFT_1099009 [Roridomyces roridus]